LVADGSDNFPTRYLVNDICVQLNKPCVYGSVNQFEGQVAVFHAPDAQGTYSPNYRNLYPTPPPSDMVPDCATGGVLGVLPGIIGSMQALEVIKLVTGVGQPLTGRLLVFDGLTMESRIFKYKHRPDKQALTEKMISDDYNSFCGIVDDKEEEPVQEVTPAALRQWQAAGIPLQYIDVREPMEHLSDPFGGTLLPLSVIVAHADKIAQDRKVVIYCQTGLRSATAVRLLQRQYGWNHLYNLSGGVKEWVKTRHSP
jgi:adenylyltransferase/sulfurtransferase